MISKDTILSIFNEKGTLLKWLQKLEKALKNDTLTGVTISQPTTTTAVLTFNFKDGTTLDSDVIELPPGAAGTPGLNGTNGTDGAPGKNGNGIVSINSEASYVSGNDTITPITIETDDSTEHITVSARNGRDGTNGINGTNGTDGTNGSDGAIHALGTHNLTGPEGNSYKLSKIFSAHGILKPGQIVLFRGDKTENGKLYKYVGERNLFDSVWKPWNAADWEYEGSFKGDPGEAGVSVSSITALGYRPGTGANIGYTETMLKAHMSDNTDIEFSAFAKNGEANNLYEHFCWIKNTSGQDFNMYLHIICDKETINMRDIANYFISANMSSMSASGFAENEDGQPCNIVSFEYHNENDNGAISYIDGAFVQAIIGNIETLFSIIEDGSRKL